MPAVSRMGITPRFMLPGWPLQALLPLFRQHPRQENRTQPRSYFPNHQLSTLNRLMTQRPLNLTLNQRTVLVKVDSVMDVRGVSADVVYDWADGAAGSISEEGLVWVWNVAVDPAGEKRDLRFWFREVIAPETTKKLDLDEVIALVLGDRKNFHAGEVCHLLRVRRPTLIELRGELNGRLKSSGAFFPRRALRDFLHARWLGNTSHPKVAVGGGNTLHATNSKLNGAASPAAPSLCRV